MAGSIVADSNATAAGMGESHSLSESQRGHRREAQQQEVVLDNDSRQHSLDTVGEPAVALPRESGIINRSFNNVSPRPYISVEGMCGWYYMWKYYLVFLCACVVK